MAFQAAVHDPITRIGLHVRHSGFRRYEYSTFLELPSCINEFFQPARAQLLLRLHAEKAGARVLISVSSVLWRELLVAECSKAEGDSCIVDIRPQRAVRPFHLAVLNYRPSKLHI